MKITIIADNYVDTAGLVAEHGFACIIEANGKKILFDTGQGDALINNISALGIQKDIDMLVFSHGHYDHTGGLTRYLAEVSEYTSEIYASRYVFDEHMKLENGEYKFIGFGNAESDLSSFKLNMNDELKEISDGIYLSGPVKRYEEFDADKLLFVMLDNSYQKDMFRDEQYLIVKTEEGAHIVTGCTHCGAVNMLMDFKQKFAGVKLLSVTGGLHLFRSTEDETEHVVKFLESEDVKSINTGHCTGLNAAMQMKTRLGEKVTFTKAGLQIQL